MSDRTKTCTICKQAKPIDDFALYRKRVEVHRGGDWHWYHKSRCKDCETRYMAAQYERSKHNRRHDTDDCTEIAATRLPALAHCHPLGIPPRCDEFERQRLARVTA